MSLYPLIKHPTASSLDYISATSTGTILSLDDNALTVGTGNGAEVMTTVLKNYANLNFLTDGLAAAGGVPLGGVYHTAGALKVRIT